MGNLYAVDAQDTDAPEVAWELEDVRCPMTDPWDEGYIYQQFGWFFMVKNSR